MTLMELLTSCPCADADLACERGRCYIHNLLNMTDAASATTSSSEEAARKVYASAERIWGGGPGTIVRQKMFYI